MQSQRGASTAMEISTTSLIAAGKRVFMRTAGSGTPLLLLHSITTSSLVWRNVMPSLARHYKTIAPDLLGFGDSEKSHDCDFSIPAQAKILHDLCKQQGLSSVNILAHDLGTGVALYLMYMDPTLVKSFITLNTSDSKTWLILPVQRISECEDESLEERVNKLFFLGMKRALSSKTVISESTLQSYFQPFAGRAGALHFQRILRSLKAEDLKEAELGLSGNEVKTLILWGNKDQNLPLEIAEGISTLLPNSELQVVDGAGHFPQEDNPQFIVESAQAFLGG